MKQQCLFARLGNSGLSAVHATCGGFTLIELLVVVLIIGILVAIALPRYERAVEKSRSTEAILWLESYAKAQNLYYMATNSYTTDLNSLDIQLPVK